MYRYFLIILIGLILINGRLFAQMPQLTLQTGHSDEVVALAFSNDGKYLASAGKDNVIIIWDFNLGKQIRSLKCPAGNINFIKFFDSGDRIVSGGSSGKLLLWEIASETILRSIPVDTTSEIISFDISPDNRQIAACCASGKIVFWNPEDNHKVNFPYEDDPPRFIGEYLSDQSKIISVKYSLNGEELAICRNAGIYFFNFRNPAASRVLTSKDKRKFVWMNYDKDQNFIYSDLRSFKKFGKVKFEAKPRNSVIRRYDVQKQKTTFSRAGNYGKYKFTGGSYNSDNSLFAAVNEDNLIYIWNSRTGKHYFDITDHKNAVSVLMFHPQKSNILVTCDAERDLYVWDITDKKQIRMIRSTTHPITAISVNESGSLITLAANDNSIKIFELKDNVNLKSLTGNKSNICGLGYSPSGEQVLSVGLDNTIKYWDLTNNNISKKLKGNSNPALMNSVLNFPFLSLFANTYTSFYFTRTFALNNQETLEAMDITIDNNYLAVGGKGFKSGYFYKLLVPRMFPIYVINNETEKVEKKFNAHYVSVNSLSFNKTGKYLASSGMDYNMGSKTKLNTKPGTFKFRLNQNYDEVSSLKIWDVENKKLLSSFEPKSQIKSLTFNTTNDTIIFADKNKNVVIFDYRNNLAKKLATGTGPILFFPDGKSFLYQDLSFVMKQLNVEGNKYITEFKGHNDKITSSALFKDGTRLLTAGWDGTVKLWDTENGSELVTLFAINEIDFLIKTPENYYFATKNAMREIGFTFGMKFYPFEQFDLQYNRPDIVLRQLGNTSEELLAAYHRAYQKRISKLGFTEDMFGTDFHIPEVKIMNEGAIEPVVTTDFINLKIKAVDSKYKLDRINIWINDVAIYGKNGIDQRNMDTGESEKEIKIQLANGVNKIQVSALNQKGAESLKETIEVDCKSGNKKPDLYLVSVGVSTYKDTRFNLDYASKDAKDMASLFNADTSLYNKVFIKTITDEQVTRVGIESLRKFFEQAGRDDVVMLFIAGHGLLDDKLDYYFASYDMDFNNPAGKGIIYDDFEALLDGLVALKKILLMDTCYSGEVDKDEVVLVQGARTEFGDVTFRSAGAGVRSKEAFGMANTSELARELFTDLRKGTGSTVISSAGGAEYAMEGQQWKNGLFTFCVVNGISKKEADLNRDGKIMLSELQDYVRNNVSILSGGRQSPTSRIQNVSLDFQVW